MFLNIKSEFVIYRGMVNGKQHHQEADIVRYFEITPGLLATPLNFDQELKIFYSSGLTLVPFSP